MTASKDDILPYKTIECHRIPYMTLYDHKNAIQDHTRSYKAMHGKANEAKRGHGIEKQKTIRGQITCDISPNKAT